MIQVLTEYQDRLSRTGPAIRQLRVRARVSLWIAAIALLAVLLLFFAASQQRLPVWHMALPAPVILAAGYCYGVSRSSWIKESRRSRYYERAIGRLQEEVRGEGFDGLRYSVSGHPYEVDLQIFGSGSAFETLCTARTEIGRRRLAQFLTEPVGLDEIRDRQKCVLELIPLIQLREDLALLGKCDFQDSSFQMFADWIATPWNAVPGFLRVSSFLNSLCLGVLLLAGFVTNISGTTLLHWIPVFLGINMALAAIYRQQTSSVNDSVRMVGVEIEVLREGIELVETQSFRSERLRAIQETFKKGQSARWLRQLERFTNGLNQCDKPFFDLLSRMLIVRTQLFFAIEDWKSRHEHKLEAWLNAWAEFEAFAAISGYAKEHPDDVFPSFVSGPAHFQAQGLGHPLLPIASCIRNDIDLDSASSAFYIISGSNMSGKSTLLRAIGLNTVLANAGAPVRARSLELTVMEIVASLSIVDSMHDGRSKFLAEIERVKAAVVRSRCSTILFLIDEILGGTNSRDRRLASEAVVRTLIENGAIGAISTHDLALTEMRIIDRLRGINVHMGSRSTENPMDFDYRLKPGVSRERNAVAIASMMGVAVIDTAE